MSEGLNLWKIFINIHTKIYIFFHNSALLIPIIRNQLLTIPPFLYHGFLKLLIIQISMINNMTWILPSNSLTRLKIN